MIFFNCVFKIPLILPLLNMHIHVSRNNKTAALMICQCGCLVIKKMNYSTFNPNPSIYPLFWKQFLYRLFSIK